MQFVLLFLGFILSIAAIGEYSGIVNTKGYMGGVSSSLAKAYHGLGFVGAFILLGATVYALLSHIAGKATQPPPKKEEEVRRLDLRPGRTGCHSTSDARADPASLSLSLSRSQVHF